MLKELLRSQILQKLQNKISNQFGESKPLNCKINFLTFYRGFSQKEIIEVSNEQILNKIKQVRNCKNWSRRLAAQESSKKTLDN